MHYVRKADREAHMSNKSAHIITWWQKYADETSKKLPDMDVLMTPHRFINFIHEVCACPFIFKFVC
eukprot:6155323-Pleurochrysis_carterae.AAC.1